MIRIAAALALTVALGGCSTGARLTPEQAVGLIKAFGDAGCRGDVHLKLELRQARWAERRTSPRAPTAPATQRLASRY